MEDKEFFVHPSSCVYNHVSVGEVIKKCLCTREYRLDEECLKGKF